MNSELKKELSRFIYTLWKRQKEKEQESNSERILHE